MLLLENLSLFLTGNKDRNLNKKFLLHYHQKQANSLSFTKIFPIPFLNPSFHIDSLNSPRKGCKIMQQSSDSLSHSLISTMAD